MESKNMKRMERALSERCKKEIGQCSYEELYTALLGIAEEESLSGCSWKVNEQT